MKIKKEYNKEETENIKRRIGSKQIKNTRVCKREKMEEKDKDKKEEQIQRKKKYQKRKRRNKIKRKRTLT